MATNLRLTKTSSGYVSFKRRKFLVELLENRLMMAADFEQSLSATAVGLESTMDSTALSSDQINSLFKTRVAPVLTSLVTGGRPAHELSGDSVDDLLMWDDQGRLDVHFSGQDVGSALPLVTDLGFEPLYVDLVRNSLDGFLPLSAIANLQSVLEGLSVGVVPNYRPETGKGLVNSEADIVLQTQRVRQIMPTGYDGTGMRIGVLSDSYGNIAGGVAADIASGDLPAGGVTVIQDLGSGGIDEGRAMLQLVHDLAPGAALGFASAFVGGQAGFANNIRALANTFNANVITDDVFYFAEPFFQDGVIAQAIDEVVQNNNVAYFSLAGNLGSQAYETVGPYTEGSTSFGLTNFGGGTYNTTQALDLNPGAGVDFRQTISLSNGQRAILTLQWDAPFFSSVTNDVDFFLIDQATNEAVAISAFDNTVTDEPLEFISFINTTGATRNYELIVERWSGAAPGRLKWVNYGANNFGPLGTIEYRTDSPTVIPHSAAAGAMSVGAAPYFNQLTPASYTSIGPATILFNATGTPIAPTVRAKPDMLSIDGTNTTFFGSDADGDGRPNFFGTSAAAPHAAAVGALVRQANPAFTPAQVYARIKETATDVGAPGPDNVTGAGLINAHKAIYGAATPTALPAIDGFESGLDENWEVKSTGNGRVQVTTRSAPAGGAYQVTMDTFANGFGLSLNEATLHFNATGASNIELIFQHKEFNDEDHPMPATFTGSSLSDGVALSVDGINWFRLVSLTGAASSNSFRAHKFNLTQFANTVGITLGSNVRLKFQQYDDSAINSDGMAFDNISLIVPTSPSGAWEALGPFGATGGQTENVSPSNNVAGALHTVLAHPTNANILYVGSVNGGVWKTTNATAPSPTWTPLTDALPSQSIGAMVFDTADVTFNTIYAGVGRYSSFGQVGAARVGLYKSTDGGASFQLINGGGVLNGKNISGIYANGNTIVVSVNIADSFTYGNIGIFRSTNGGASFTQLTSGNGAATGLPGGSSYDLVVDPNNNNILYTSTIFSDAVGGQNGVYRSTNQGATWTRISSSAMNSLMNNNTSNVELAVGKHNNVYAAIINNGQVAGLFRSGDGGTNWVQMQTPTTNENGTDVGLNPGGNKGPGPGSAPELIAGGQGNIHFSILADPNNANIVYVGGDRQPLEFQNPTSIGARDFSGRLFRGDASLPLGQQWFHLTHSNTLGVVGGGTASSSSPHADSREMTFDAAGNLIEVDDGGVYRRTLPQSNLGDWFAITGNLQVAESHNVSWDAISNVAITGNQDNGTTYQPFQGAQTWVALSTADGGDVAVDDVSQAASGISVRYSSFQNFGAFRRTTWDATGNLLSTTFPPLTVTSGTAFSGTFVTKLALNNINPTRLIIHGGNNAVYESFNQGNSIAEIAVGVGFASIEQNAIEYGGRKNGVNNADVLWIGRNSDVYFRSGPGALALVPSDPTLELIRDLTVNPNDWAHAFVIDRDQVFATTNQGASWTDITGNLMALTTDLRSIAFIDGRVDAVVVGTGRGVFVAQLSTPNVWVPLAPNMPNVLVYDMEVDLTDNVLVAGTFGRGAWLLRNVTNVIGDLFAEPPVFNQTSYAFSLPENATSGAAVGATSATDPDVGDVLVYSLSGTGASNFQINPATGAITVSPTASFNALLTPTYNLTVSVSDGQFTANAPVTVSMTAVVAVANTKVYYKGSFFANTSVNAALDNSKVLAHSGTTPVTLNYSNLLNTTLGINGLVIDVNRMPATSLSASDFVFRMSPQGLFNAASNPPSSWATAPAPTGIFVTPATPTTPARVRLEWGNNTIANRWLQIQVLNSSATGLPVTEVYYVGHLQGELNGDASIGGAYFVTNADLTLVTPIGSVATVDSPRDVDKSGFVQNADGVAIRGSINAARSLRNLTIPVAGSADEGRLSGARPASGSLTGALTVSLAGALTETNMRVSPVVSLRSELNALAQPLPAVQLSERLLAAGGSSGSLSTFSAASVSTLNASTVIASVDISPPAATSVEHRQAADEFFAEMSSADLRLQLRDSPLLLSDGKN